MVSNSIHRLRRGSLTMAVLLSWSIGASTHALAADEPEIADIVLLGGQVITVDDDDRVVQAVAVRGNKLLAVGSDEQVRKHVGPRTRVIELAGRTVTPGFIETHCHPLGVARSSLEQTYAELVSIAEVQAWIRQQAASLPDGTWIRVPRTEITRLTERRHPTRDELDAAAPRHPVVFTSVRKNVLNSRGFEALGIADDAQSMEGGELIRDASGRPWMFLGGEALLREAMQSAAPDEAAVRKALINVFEHYSAVGITSVFDRANDLRAFRLYESLRDAGELNVRVAVTFREQFRSGEDVARYVEKLGLKPRDGDDWVRAGPLKITVDGGIHWGNTYLSEPYGAERATFYLIDDAGYQGDLRFSREQMQSIFAVGHRLGWQMSCHVTGDGGMDAVLDALEASNTQSPVAPRRFNLIHAYFPSAEIVARCRQLNIGVDTQTYLYYRDADALARVYGDDWAARFIGLGHWVRGGVPVGINADHMIGLDPDHAMNSYNPLLAIWIAVARRSDSGQVYGPEQRLSRLDAVKAMTRWAAWLTFDEPVKGSLEPGKLADLVVLDGNYLDCAEEEIRQLKPLLTMVDGRVVYERAERE